MIIGKLIYWHENKRDNVTEVSKIVTLTKREIDMIRAMRRADGKRMK